MIEEIENFCNENEWLVKVILSLATIIIATFIYKIIMRITEKTIEKKIFFNTKRFKTYIRFIKSINRYIIIIVTLLVILKIYGINISSILAGIGIISIIIGLAIQDFLKDIIRGTSILSDNYFSVGDVIKYKNIEGKVLVIGLKTTSATPESRQSSIRLTHFSYI